MKSFKERILKRIEQLKLISGTQNIYQATEELYTGTLSLASMVYGVNSPQFASLKDIRNTIAGSKYNENAKFEVIFHTVLGFLTNFQKEVEDDLLSSLEREISGDLFADFVLMARLSIEAGNKDVAAVLACAALEDSLKRLASMNGLNTDDQDMSQVINSLKSKSVIAGPQLKILQSYTTLRNKAFHADWEKIDTPDVKSLIAFVEDFLLKHFS
ncbi:MULTISPECIES: hypothetical protein [unclassified Leptospira]|uniref:hypothetical protein n=1 Tax=unclassified Leptospira TaxID=2633828 RepID=UPI0002BE1932|nr:MULTISPECIES: hypothetical protein [unclassified Leptospira]EMJ98769.1 hypothetical protein LEP1GSC192_3151 [Leptospira sp. B5-022]MCR1795729.1 hypothetical protein [Leptospira sp. id769339]